MASWCRGGIARLILYRQPDLGSRADPVEIGQRGSCDGVPLGRRVPEGAHPRVELGTPHEDLPAHAVVAQGMRRVVQAVA
jgi:hypothetical protein